MATKPVIVGTDGSRESQRAVEWAARETVLRATTLSIVAVPVLPPRMTATRAAPGTVSYQVEQAMSQALAEAEQQAAAQHPGLAIETHLVAGAPAEVLSGAAQDASLVVVGSRGAGGFSAMILGSVSRYAATHASSPVVVVRDEIGATHRQVGIGIGGLVGNTAALTFAFEEAALRKASVVAIHAWDTPRSDVSRAAVAMARPGEEILEAKASRQLDNLLDEWRDKYPDVPVSHDVVHGHPGRILSGLSARADLVVLGRHPAHHGPGAVIHAVLNHAHGPVVTVPSS